MILPRDAARSFIGQDDALSRRKEGFDSPTGYQTVKSSKSLRIREGFYDFGIASISNDA